MLLIPLLAIVVAVGVAVTLLQRRARSAAGAAPSTFAPDEGTSFAPASLEGKLAVGALLLGVLLTVLVNVIQVPYLGAAALLAAAVLACIARFARRDRSLSVLVVLVVSALALLGGVLFLAGEALIGHD